MTKKKYTIEDLKSNKIAVQVKTLKDYENVLHFLHSNGVTPFSPVEDMVKEEILAYDRKDLCLYVDLLGNVASRAIEHCKPANFKIISTDQLEGLEPTAKPKYNIEDLKSKKIAVHLPTQEEWDKCMKWLYKKGLEGIKQFTTTLPYISLNNKWSVSYCSHNSFGREYNYHTITIDQIEGLEPTAEIPTAKVYVIGMTIDFADYPDMKEIIIKYQGKEKVITRDDFVDVNKMGESQYSKGSRAWALLALDRGEKVRMECWAKESYLFLYEFNDGSSGIVDEEGNFAEDRLFKDGWELYKDEKKTMTLREAIEQQKDFKFHNDVYKYVSNAHDYHGYEKEELQCENEIAFELNDIINHLDEQVEIIEED